MASEEAGMGGLFGGTWWRGAWKEQVDIVNLPTLSCVVCWIDPSSIVDPPAVELCVDLHRNQIVGHSFCKKTNITNDMPRNLVI